MVAGPSPSAILWVRVVGRFLKSVVARRAGVAVDVVELVAPRQSWGRRDLVWLGGTHDATRSTEVSWQEPPSGSSAVDGASHVALPPAGTLATDEMALPTTVPAASTTFSPMT